MLNIINNRLIMDMRKQAIIICRKVSDKYHKRRGFSMSGAAARTSELIK